LNAALANATENGLRGNGSKNSEAI
jgi:hypothetical protein